MSNVKGENDAYERGAKDRNFPRTDAPSLQELLNYDNFGIH